MSLVSLALLLRPLQQADPEKPVPRWWGRAAHHLLMETLGLNDDVPELRPFTASTLYGYFPDHQLDLEGNYIMRFTGLNEVISAPLVQAVQTGGPLAPGATVNLDYLDFQVLAVHYENGSHPLAAQTTYQELATASLLSFEPAPHLVSFTFVSPTTFHRDGRQVAYPLPELVIGSLLDKWNAFAPIAFPVQARRYAAECLALSRFELKSRRVKVAGGSQSGMVGRAIFSTLNYDRYWMSLMHTLSRYSYYSGVGAKTTMGMGQCRRPVERGEMIATK
ncbi:MAG: CRISPR system precrRNA processing endoribonuclease RAMP protein Cas6 [Anaerolineae bacterium]|nr:CRISPR system precrRNA processing endoribonuclease RAMP protein Cas6 [Anaerolineae bacterium]MCI0609636.1 CRISPR system precrRNA processing endoribonuclease RAMP protein Cas6 [Anaerolineae bacterium]